MSDKEKKQVEADTDEILTGAEEVAKRQMARVGIRLVDPERDIFIKGRTLEELLINTYLKGCNDTADRIRDNV